MFLALRKIELAPQKSFFRLGTREDAIRLRASDGGELVKELAASAGHKFRQFGIVIGEVIERRGSGELLALKEHGRGGAEQQQRGHRSQPAGTGQLMNASAAQ